jgi:hypothetical protein
MLIEQESDTRPMRLCLEDHANLVAKVLMSPDMLKENVVHGFQSGVGAFHKYAEEDLRA